MPTAFKVSVIAVENGIRRDLKLVRRIVPAATAAALNRANVTARAFLVRRAQQILGLPNQKALRRQIRIPRKLRANKERQRAGGVYGALVPKSLGGGGEERVFDNRKPSSIPGGASQPFIAVMKSGHRGYFVRMPRSHGKYRLVTGIPRDKNLWGRSELPIREVFTNETPRLFLAAQEAVREGNTRFLKRFDTELEFRLKKFASR